MIGAVNLVFIDLVYSYYISSVGAVLVVLPFALGVRSMNADLARIVEWNFVYWPYVSQKQMLIMFFLT